MKETATMTIKDEEPSSWITKIRHFLHLDPQNREELISLLRDAHNRHLIDSDTLAMLEGIMIFSLLRVRDIVHPKNQMIAIPKEAPIREIIQLITDSGHTRFPVYEDNLNTIIGILHAKDILKYHFSQDDDFNMLDIIREATFIPESKRLDILLSEFRLNRNHMAIVVDEYGAVSGFVTIEDIIEQIIGDIADEFDIDDETFIKKHSDEYYTMKGQTPIDLINETLHTTFETDQFDTLGGIIITEFGYLPKRGESITINGFTFKILNADARRIKLISCTDCR
jgi:magnesium and cobalt transporter